MDIDESKTTLSYVYVEVLPKSKINPKLTSIQAEKFLVSGLFAGLYINEEDNNTADMYLVIKTNDKTTKLVNMDTHGIVSIRTLRANEQMFYFLKNIDNDQKYGYEKLVSLMAELTAEKRVLSDGMLIDLSTYKELPLEYREANRDIATEKGLPKATTSSPTKCTVQGSGRSVNYLGSSYSGGYSYMPKKPTVFKRTIKLAGAHLLGGMKKKVLAAMSGTYNAPTMRDPSAPTHSK